MQTFLFHNLPDCSWCFVRKFENQKAYMCCFVNVVEFISHDLFWNHLQIFLLKQSIGMLLRCLTEENRHGIKEHENESVVCILIKRCKWLYNILQCPFKCLSCAFDLHILSFCRRLCNVWMLVTWSRQWLRHGRLSM